MKRVVRSVIATAHASRTTRAAVSSRRCISSKSTALAAATVRAATLCSRPKPASSVCVRLTPGRFKPTTRTAVCLRPSLRSRFSSSSSNGGADAQVPAVQPQHVDGVADPDFPAPTAPEINVSWDDFDAVLDSMVKVYATVAPPNFLLPWQNKPLKEITGSGFAVDIGSYMDGAGKSTKAHSGKKTGDHSSMRILTNAHCIADHKYVELRKSGSAIRYAATVEAVGHECDLALLKVEDPTFWQGVSPLRFSDVPSLQEAVLVVGYPLAGDNLSITKGVVSRVEPQQYAHGASKLLAIQIDAAINSGNSGGPALDPESGLVVGVAFQNLQGAENIGFIIPVPIIEHFLGDAVPGPYQGFCSLGVQVQTLENRYFQRGLRVGLDKPLNGEIGPEHEFDGVLVNVVLPVSPAAKVLKQYDVITEIDGYPIARDGSVLFRGRERIGFEWIISQKFAGEVCAMKILRQGEELTVEVTMDVVDALVPVFQYDKTPSYLIYAGLVFVPLTQPFLHEWGYEWYNRSPRRLCDLAMNGIRQEDGEQVIVLSQVLAHEVNSGYQWMANLQVLKLNGTKLRNLSHMTSLLDDISAQVKQQQDTPEAGGSLPSVVFELEDSRLLVLDAVACTRAHDEILSRHRVPAARSADV